MSETKEILLLRHGKTQGNALRQYIGSTDEALSPEGRAELSERRYPAADKVYISSMLRCRESAELLFPGAALHTVPGLREMDFGHFEGRSYLDMAEDAEYSAWLASSCEAPIPGGEKKSDFTERCCTAFLDVLSRDEASRLVFVVHGGTIMAILSRFGSPERGYYDWSVGNGRGFRLTWDGERLRVLQEF